MKADSKDKVRLYSFFNFDKGMSGQSFAICDFHLHSQRIPDNCLLELIADKATLQCEQCYEEENEPLSAQLIHLH